MTSGVAPWEAFRLYTPGYRAIVPANSVSPYTNVKSSITPYCFGTDNLQGQRIMSSAGKSLGTQSPPLSSSDQDQPMGVSGISGQKPQAVPDTEQRHGAYHLSRAVL